MVSATLRIISALTCWSLRAKASFTKASRGAWLNHTTKLRKNANQAMCRVLIVGSDHLSRFSEWLSDITTSARASALGNFRLHGRPGRCAAVDVGQHPPPIPPPYPPCGSGAATTLTPGRSPPIPPVIGRPPGVDTRGGPCQRHATHRPRRDPPMHTVDEALSELLAAADRHHARVQVITTATLAARNLVLAADIHSPVDVPPAANSAMDGYAYAHRDLGGEDRWLPISQRIPAGRAPAPLDAGTAARIFTGSEIPPGADTVAMQENCTAADGRVLIQAAKNGPGDNIRGRGQDVRRGDTVLQRGARLRPQDLGLLASLGLAEVAVYRPLRVGVFATGDELVPPGQPLAPGQIYNSN